MIDNLHTKKCSKNILDVVAWLKQANMESNLEYVYQNIQNTLTRKN